tara:strand:- start:51 stop:560 length:510 start_codon:yes stop_codon:yes gene_type:complete
MAVTTIPTAGIADDAVTAAKATGFGLIGQVKSTIGANFLSTSSTSYAAVSGLSLSITPSSTSSKILVLHSAPSVVAISNTSNMGHIAIYRDSTNITTAGHNSSGMQYQYEVKSNGGFIQILDSPSTTSSVTYAIYAKTDNTGITLDYGSYQSNGSQGTTSGLTLMEVLA